MTETTDGTADAAAWVFPIALDETTRPPDERLAYQMVYPVVA